MKLIPSVQRKLQVMILLVLMSAISMIADGQTYMETFGQNRIQTRKFVWKFFDTKHFRVYHYDKAGRDLGRYVAEEAENDIPMIEKKLGGQFPHRFSIILYNSYEDYRQTNVGLKQEQQSLTNTRAGSVNLVGDKLVVYFTGQHGDLRRQIRKGMAEVVMQRMMFGDDLKQMVKNALVLNLPPWVTEGYIAYLVDGWDTKASSEWKSLLDARPKTGFYQLAEEYPELAGKAFWKFVSTQFGQNAVKGLLYSMKDKTSLNKAMKEPSIMNMKVTKAYDSCIKFYRNSYAQDALQQEMPDSAKGLIALNVPKDGTTIRNIRVSPRASDIAYVAWKDGKYTVYTQKTAGGQLLSPLLEGGQKDLTEQTDPNYPMLAWSTNGNKLAILYKKGDKTMLRIYNSFKGRIENYAIQPKFFDRALDMCFMQDDERLIFSAIKKSQTDLYMMTIKGRGSKITNVTDDLWDDVAPTFVSGGSRTGILFLSNRPRPNLKVDQQVNELPVGPMNVFFYNTTTQKTELLQCTDVKKGTVMQPIQYGFDNFAYLYDSNGVNNKYVVLFARDKKNKDSAYSVPITNYNSSMIGHQYNMASGDVADVIQVKSKYMVYFHELQMPGQNVPVKTLQPTSLSIEKPEPMPEPPKMVTTDTRVLPKPGENNVVEKDEPTPAQVKSGNAFQSEFADDTVAFRPKKKGKGNGIAKDTARAGQPGVADSSLLVDITDSAYVKMKPTAYRANFKPDFFSVKLNNSMLFSQYQSIASNGGSYSNPPLGALATISIDEMMEDKRITAAYQLPTDFGGSTYMLKYENFRKRLDWGVSFLRFTEKKMLKIDYIDTRTGRPIFPEPVDQPFKTVLNAVQGDFSYPLDRLRSIRFHTALRQDRMVEKVTDTLSLAFPIPNTEAYTSLTRLEYVFDNTISPAINIFYGTRFKFYGELFYGLDKSNKSCYNLGLDIRNYQKLYKTIILANRLAYAHSDGTSKVQYLAGGVDNWFSAQKAPGGGPLDGFGFQMLATPLRGYKQNARTGNNFAVFNTEVRAPIIAAFAKRPIKSLLLKNLQVIAFCDAGMAWNGFLPDNSGSTYSAQSSSLPTSKYIQLDINTPGGLAVGYGAGLRTMLRSYFLRLDAAWNIEGKPKPIVYFSMGMDF